MEARKYLTDACLVLLGIGLLLALGSFASWIWFRVNGETALHDEHFVVDGTRLLGLLAAIFLFAAGLLYLLGRLLTRGPR